MYRRLTLLMIAGVALIVASCRSSSSGNVELASGPKPRGRIDPVTALRAE